MRDTCQGNIKINYLNSFLITDLVGGVVQRAAVLDDELRAVRLLVQVHLSADHELCVALGQVALLHQPLELEVLLAGDHDDLVHVGNHHPGLEQQRQVHDDVLVAGGGALHGLPPHLLVNLGVSDPVQLLALVLVLNTILMTFLFSISQLPMSN